MSLESLFFILSNFLLFMQFEAFSNRSEQEKVGRSLEVFFLEKVVVFAFVVFKEDSLICVDLFSWQCVLLCSLGNTEARVPWWLPFFPIGDSSRSKFDVASVTKFTICSSPQKVHPMIPF